jgi:tetratricopeptide (TPR) repeat protein
VLSNWWGYVTWVVPAVVALVLWLGRHRAPLLLLSGALFVIPLLPLLGFKRFLFQYYSTVAEHYQYLSMLGVGLLAGWITLQCASRRRVRRKVIIASSLLLMLLGLRSFLHAAVWRDDFSLFRHAASVNPRSFLSYNNLGYAYLSLYDPASAELNFRKAVEIEPDFPVYRRNLAEALLSLGRIEESIAQLEESLRLSERYAWAGAEQIAGAYLQAVDTAEAAGRRDRSMAYLKRALEVSPEYEPARRKLRELENAATLPSR